MWVKNPVVIIFDRYYCFMIHDYWELSFWHSDFYFHCYVTFVAVISHMSPLSINQIFCDLDSARDHVVII